MSEPPMQCRVLSDTPCGRPDRDQVGMQVPSTNPNRRGRRPCLPCPHGHPRRSRATRHPRPARDSAHARRHPKADGLQEMPRTKCGVRRRMDPLSGPAEPCVAESLVEHGPGGDTPGLKIVRRCGIDAGLQAAPQQPGTRTVTAQWSGPSQPDQAFRRDRQGPGRIRRQAGSRRFRSASSQTVRAW